jgi:hypothetical protein
MMFEEHEKLDYHNSGVKYIVMNNVLQFSSRDSDLSGTITYDEMTDIFTIHGQTHLNRTIRYLAANPLWRNYSYAGSGLPFPNPTEAYDQTPNQGIVMTDSTDRFTIKLQHPSEYYVGLGKKLLKPHVHLHLQNQNKLVTVVIGDILPYRSLKNLPGQPNRTIGR